MEQEEKSKLVKTVSMKLTPETHEMYKALYAELDPGTANEFMETILVRFRSPIEVNKENERKIKELQSHISELTEKIGKSEKDYSDYDRQISEKDAEIENLRLENENLRMTKTQLEREISELVEKHNLPEHCHIIDFDPLNEKVIQYVAARETKNRKGQNWSISDLINFYIDQWFVKGNPNGSLDNVSDRIIRELKKELQSE
ncbi:hypothetical protein LJC53_05585 [Bacteroidales bacterium OttesenSCG-928-C03]|nr:hypothetical protein [Bacteroidales bacterium OttesenSCG-928-C03]MDL2326736.1 hypothetical protein [Bacteroidales bacterium OttesenSCG-928-A14]